MAARKTTARKVKGRDVAAPVRHIRWGGRSYPLIINNRTARICEDIYAEVYGKPEMGYYDILNELSIPKHRALMAMTYAAITAAAKDDAPSWEDFDENFQLTDIEGMREALQAAVVESLPEPEEGDEKNGRAPGDPTDTPGPD